MTTSDWPAPPPELLEAIRARPGDDAPRLRWAAQLRGRDDVRAELIEMQVRLPHLGTRDPERARLERAIERFEREHADELVAPYRAALGGWSWVRGFIESCTLETRDPPSVERLFAREPIAQASLGYGTLAPVAELIGPLGQLAIGFVRGPSFCSPSLRRCVDTVLARLPSLHLNGALADDDLAFLADGAAFPRLSALSLRTCGLDGAKLRRLLDGPLVARLEALDLSDNDLDDDAIAMLATSPAVRSLRVLAIGVNPITKRGLAAIAASRELARVERLALGNLGIEPASWPAPKRRVEVTPRSYAVAPNEVDIVTPSYPDASGPGSRALVPNVAWTTDALALANLPALSDLDLSGVSLGGDMLAALVGSPLWPRLRVLNLGPRADAAELTLLAEALPRSGLAALGLDTYAGVLGVLAKLALRSARDACEELLVDAAREVLAGDRLDALAAMLAELAHLRRLFLVDVPLTAALAGAIGRMPLEALALDGPLDTGLLERVLAALAGRTLRQLILRVPEHTALEAVARWPGLASVEALTVHRAADDACAAALAGSRFVDQVRHLRWVASPLGDPGVAALLARRWEHLVTLDLRANQISVAGVRALARAVSDAMPKLERIALFGNPCGFGWEEWIDGWAVTGGNMTVSAELAEALAGFPPHLR